MRRKVICLTLINQIICISTIIWLLIGERDVAAQGQLQEFLGPIYYGQTSVTAVFDHEFPTTAGVEDGNTFVRHYDNEPYEDPPGGFGYDQHEGIDYGLHYRVVLAAADEPPIILAEADAGHGYPPAWRRRPPPDLPA